MYWGKEVDQWVLQGGWLINRADIVSWMRSTYWKHNHKKQNQKKVAEDARDATREVGDGNEGGGPSSGSHWKDVMLQ